MRGRGRGRGDVPGPAVDLVVAEVEVLEGERVVGGRAEAGDAVVGQVEAGEVGAEAGQAAGHHRERVVCQVLLGTENKLNFRCNSVEKLTFQLLMDTRIEDAL